MCSTIGSCEHGGFSFGYSHYVIFAAVGAVSAGVEVELDAILGHAHVSSLVAGLALTLPVAIFVVSVWAVLLRDRLSSGASVLILVAAVLMAASGWLPDGEYTVVALLLVGVVVLLEVDAARASRGTGSHRARDGILPRR